MPPAVVLSLAERLLEQRRDPAPPDVRAVLDEARDVALLDDVVADLRTSVDAFTADLVHRLATALEPDLAKDPDDPLEQELDAEFDDQEAEEAEFLSCPPEHPPGPMCIVHDCLKVFADHGNPPVIASTDLAADLSRLSGLAEDGLPYPGLTPRRLARLLGPYGILSRNRTVSGQRQRKSYDRSLLAATAKAGCC